MALTLKEPSLSNVGDIILNVRDTCTGVSVRADLTYDMRKRVRLSQSEIGGKCLRYEITALDIPADRTCAVCDYYQSGSANDH